MNRPNRLQPLIMRLQGLCSLGPAAACLLEDALLSTQAHRVGGAVAGPGAGTGGVRAIVAGWVCQERTLPDGRQQIVRLLLPGDLLGSGLGPGPAAAAGLQALTAVNTATLRPFTRPGPDGDAEGAAGAELRQAMELVAALDEWWMIVQVVRLGRQTALERMASLLLELRDRLRAVGLGGRSRFPMPLTQEILANTLGLSTVHMNRTLQLLRHDQLITLTAGEVELLDLPRLEELADYVPPPIASLPREPA